MCISIFCLLQEQKKTVIFSWGIKNSFPLGVVRERSTRHRWERASPLLRKLKTSFIFLLKSINRNFHIPNSRSSSRLALPLGTHKLRSRCQTQVASTCRRMFYNSVTRSFVLWPFCPAYTGIVLLQPARRELIFEAAIRSSNRVMPPLSWICTLIRHITWISDDYGVHFLRM